MNNLILQVDIFTIVVAVIGAIIGAFAAYLFALKLENKREGRERDREIEFKERVASIVSQELKTYSAFLEQQLVTFKTVPSNERKSYGTGFLRDFKELSRDYITMNPELKAKVFDINTLTTLAKVYQSIQLLTPKKVEELLSQEAQPTKNKFEFEIEGLKNDIGIGLKSIENMIIEEYENRLTIFHRIRVWFESR